MRGKVKAIWKSFSQKFVKMNQVVYLYAQYAENVIGSPQKYEKIIKQ